VPCGLYVSVAGGESDGMLGGLLRRHAEQHGLHGRGRELGGSCDAAVAEILFCLFASLSNSKICPAGYYCSDAGSAPVECSGGSFAIEGSVKCTLCSNGTA
jgi:hypothetical protein